MIKNFQAITSNTLKANRNKMKTIIYCRVSSQEQAKHGYSLDGQERECRQFAEQQGYDVDRVFIERGESAKTTNRTELQKLIKYTVSNKRQLTAVIIWKYDRLARNLSDQTELIKHFAHCNIRVLSVTENNEDNSTGRLMRNIIGSFAQFENDVKSERTINGMKQRLQDGRWCWHAPVGYSSKKDDTGKTVLTPNKESAYIQEAFALAETALYKQTEIVSKLKKKGFSRLHKDMLNRLLRNPLYASLIIKPEWFSAPIEAVHKAIITREQFHKVQMILDGKKPNHAPKQRNHPDFPLRRFVECPECGKTLTGSWSTGRMKIKYGYYHCMTKGCSMRIKKVELEDKFYNYVKGFQPKKEMLDLFEAIVIDVWKTKQADHIKEQHKLETEVKVIETKKERIDELMIKGVFDEITYKEKVEQVRGELLAKKVYLSEVTIDLNDIESCLTYCKFFLSNVADLWAQTSLDLKQRFQSLIFPEGVIYNEGAFRTNSTALIFSELGTKSPSASYLAPGTGGEDHTRTEHLNNVTPQCFCFKACLYTFFADFNALQHPL